MICARSLCYGEVITPTKKRVRGLHVVSISRKDGKTFSLFQSLNTQCRYDYCNVIIIKRDLKRKMTQDLEEDQCLSLRSQYPKFNFHADCLFCGFPTKAECTRSVSAYQIRTSSYQESLLQHCKNQRPQDKWAETVLHLANP